MSSSAIRTALCETPLGADASLPVAQAAQKGWASVSLPQRLKILKQFRQLLAERATQLAAAIPTSLPRSKADTLSAEVLPLAAAVRFLELRAPRLLAAAVISPKGRPAWLRGLRLQIQRDPWGVVLVIAPSNYPLFLPGVQTVQALAAGNAVVWKPGAGGTAIARVMAKLLTDAGLPAGLLQVAGESVEEAQQLLHAGVDKVVMTGSEFSGRAVLQTAAEHLIPATVELSGCDAMFVLADADIARSVHSLLFGLRLNGSGTCIAPRRIFLHRHVAESFKSQLLAGLSTVPAIAVSNRTALLVRLLVADAIEQGALALTTTASRDGLFRPVILDRAVPGMQVMRSDVFAPVAGLCVFGSEEEALQLASECPFSLGATVFGSTAAAANFAKRVRAGVVVVNDMIAPTADPRISFGGRDRSGFGKSRGIEGLLEMTFSKTVAVQTAKRLRHLEPPHPQALALFSGFLKVAHGHGISFRVRSLLALGKVLSKKTQP